MLNLKAPARVLAPASRALLLGTALGCSIAVFAATAPAYAANDACGAVTRNTGPNNPDTVTCTSSGNSYTSGISYDQQSSNPASGTPNDLTVVLQGGATPVTVSSSGNGVLVTNWSGYSATVVSNAGVSVTSASGFTGIYAGSNGATTTIQNDGSVSAGSVGILANNQGSGTASIQNTGSVTAVTVGLQANTTSSNAVGVSITNSGALSVDNANSTATGIQAGFTEGTAAVVNSGAITVGAGATAPSQAYGVNTLSVGDVSVINNVGGAIRVTANGTATGIRAGKDNKYFATGSTVTNAADITATSATGTATGIGAYGADNGATVTSTAGNIKATGYSAYGIRADASGVGNVSITVSGGTVTANGAAGGDAQGAGIYGHATNGTVTITGSTTYASGANVFGIRGSADRGVTITTGAVTTTGQRGVGVYAYSAAGPVDVTVSGPVTTSGADAPGVVAVSYANDVKVTLNGAVKTSGAGSSGGMYGVGGAAVIAQSQNGAVTVTGAGAVTSTGDYTAGVVAIGALGATVDVSGPIVVSGKGAPGPFGSMGVAAVSKYGDTNVTVGSVTSSGVGVLATSRYGVTNVTVNGAVKAEGKYGVLAFSPYSSSGAVTVTVASGASVSGYGGVLAAGTQGATVTNSGTISANGGFAVIAVSPTSATLTNTASGVINGAVSVYSGGPNVFNNAGVWNVSGHSDIGANKYGPLEHLAAHVGGAVGQAPVITGGVMYNTGTTNVAPGTTAATTATVSGLTTWNNAGGINISNGHPGDVLDLGTAAFNGLTGSTLTVDAPKTGVGDEVLAGAVSGVTKVSVAGNQLAIGGATFFQGTSGTASNFVLAPGSAHSGFIDYAIGFDPTSVSWSLYGLPSHAVFEALKLTQAGQAFAQRSSEVWYWRTQEIRDAEAQGAHRDGFEVWGQVYGGSETEDQTRGMAISGVDISENLSTRNTWAGMQFGVDHLSDWHGGKLLWGFTAGYLEQWSDFRGGGTASWGSGAGAGSLNQAVAHDQFDLSGVNLGGYLGWSRGGFFVNGLAKADFAGADLHLNSVGLKAATNATTWSVNGEIGYRYGGPQFFFEPVAKLIAGDTQVDDWKGLGATFDYPGENSLQASLGARIGGAVSTGPIKLTPYVGAYWVSETTADNRMTFTDGSDLNLQDARAPGFARIDAGVTAKTSHGIEGFAKIVADTSSTISGVSGDLGVRWRW